MDAIVTLESLRVSLAKLDPAHFGEIRKAYFKAYEGLSTLSVALEKADASIGGETKLLSEHSVASSALSELQKSELGALV